MSEDKSDKRLEVIREFANIGAGNAATALGTLLDVDLVNDVTSCNLLPLSEVAEWLGGAEKVVAGTYTQLCGPFKSGILVILPGESAVMVVRHLTKEQADLSSLSRFQESCLREVGSICLCWYLMAVSKVADMDMIPAPPDAVVDKLGAVLDVPLAAVGSRVDTALVVHTRFKALNEGFEGYFLMLPEDEALKALMTRMEQER